MLGLNLGPQKIAWGYCLGFLHITSSCFDYILRLNFSPMVTILTLPGPYWYPINWATQLEIKCIFFSKRALADYWLCISLTKAGSYICPWTDNSVQFSRSLVSDSLHPMDCSMQGFPVRHQLLELTQTHASRVGDAIQPSHPPSSPSPPAFNLSQHQGLFQWVSSSHQVAKVLEFQLQHQSFQRIFRTDFL